MAHGLRWKHDELVLALDLYCRTPFGKLHRRNPDIIWLAEALGRTPDAVAMKCCNFASLDPAERARGVRGLSGASDADAEVFAKYAHDVAALDDARTDAVVRLTPPHSGDTSEPGPVHVDQLARQLAGQRSVAEVAVVRRARRLQSLFREIVLVSYEGACALCDLANPALLDAAHITPWSEDTSRQLDPANGVAMCVLHHRAFDRGLISVDLDMRVLLSNAVRKTDAPPMHRVAFADIDGKVIRSPRRFAPVADAFERHRRDVFIGRN